MTVHRQTKLTARLCSVLIAAGVSACAGLGADSGDTVRGSQLFAETNCPITIDGPFPATAVFATVEDLGHKAWMSALRGTDADAASRALVLVHFGPKPTPGYGASFQSAATSGRKLLLKVTQTVPAPDMMYAQVITSPCILVSVPAGSYSDIKVIDIEPAGE